MRILYPQCLICQGWIRLVAVSAHAILPYFNVLWVRQSRLKTCKREGCDEGEQRRRFSQYHFNTVQNARAFIDGVNVMTRGEHHEAT